MFGRSSAARAVQVSGDLHGAPAVRATGRADGLLPLRAMGLTLAHLRDGAPPLAAVGAPPVAAEPAAADRITVGHGVPRVPR